LWNLLIRVNKLIVYYYGRGGDLLSTLLCSVVGSENYMDRKKAYEFYLMLVIQDFVSFCLYGAENEI
jgi:hypothetical protein